MHQPLLELLHTHLEFLYTRKNKEKPLEKEILCVCEVAPTPPLNITIVKIKYGYRQGDHVRYENTKDALK
jgi:hypothetical protein